MNHLKDFDESVFQGQKTKKEKELILKAELTKLDKILKCSDDEIIKAFPSVVLYCKSLPVGRARAYCRATRPLWEYFGLWDELLSKLKEHHESNRTVPDRNNAHHK